MKNVVFWDVTPCGSCKNQSYGGFCFSLNKNSIGPSFSLVNVYTDRKPFIATMYESICLIDQSGNSAFGAEIQNGGGAQL
jgi:hypothetical protein